MRKRLLAGSRGQRKKDTDNKRNTINTTNNKKPKTGEVNPELLKALKALEMPVANPKQTDGGEAAKAEDDDDEGDSVSNAED